MENTNICEELNILLSRTYKILNELEEKKIKKNRHLNVSISELHLMEVISEYMDSGGATVTELANSQKYTLPAATIAINGLIKKGYVEKLQDVEDKRSVKIILTPQGDKINEVHKYIHRKLVRDIVKEFDEEEMKVFVRGFTKVYNFFEKMNKESTGD